MRNFPVARVADKVDVVPISATYGLALCFVNARYHSMKWYETNKEEDRAAAASVQRYR